MGYGKIYNTSWWGNALDTARTAGTEPDFFGSQMKLLTSNQPELVTNGDFSDSSWWGLDPSWSISGGSANSNGTGTIYKGGVVTIGKTYKVVVSVSSYTSGNLTYPNASNYNIPSAVGVYTFYYVANSQTISFTGNSYIGSIDNVSVQLARLELDQIEAKKCLADWIHTTALQDLNN